MGRGPRPFTSCVRVPFSEVRRYKRSLGHVIADIAFTSGIFFFVGPVLLVLTTIFEWIMGNFFSMMVCGLFTVFWLSLGVLQLPTLGLAASYSETGTNAIAGGATKEFNAVIALYLIVWGFAFFTFFIFTLKTNTVFALIFLLVSTAAWVLSGAYWKVSTGDLVEASKLQKVSQRHYLPCATLRPVRNTLSIFHGHK